MMLGRIAAVRRFAAAPLRSAAAQQRSTPLIWAMPGSGAVRNAAVVTSPRPLSIRYDSLFVKCMIAALVYFVPQDAVFLTGHFFVWHSTAKSISPKTRHEDAE